MYAIDSPASPTAPATLGLKSDLALAILEKPAAIGEYVSSAETLAALGHGGSESLTLVLRKGEGPAFVRKILDEGLMTARWDPTGTGVMLPPWKKAKQQAAYLSSLPSSVRELFPRVLSISERTYFDHHAAATVERRQLIYDMTYTPGIELSRFVAKYAPSPRVVAGIYTRVFQVLRERIHRERRRVPSRPTLEASYFKKIEERLELSHRTMPLTFSRSLLESPEIVLNGERLANAPALVQALRKSDHHRWILEPRFHSLVVGDTNTENIKLIDPKPLLRAQTQRFSPDAPPFSADDVGIRFMDPRAIGFHEDDVDTGADDPMYDAKPWHNSLGNYDMIHGEHFDLSLETRGGLPALEIAFHTDNPYARSYRGIEAFFESVMHGAWDIRNPRSSFVASDPHWAIRFAFLMGTHFAAMPPFHLTRGPGGSVNDSPQGQKRALGVYAEGVRWLNLAMGLLEGTQRDLFGVPVALPRG